MRLLVALSSLAVALAGCVGSAAPRADPLAGDYIAAVSESAAPIAERLTASFAAKHPGMRWVVKDVGSAATIELIKGGEADAGFLSRAVTLEDERQMQARGLGFTGQVLIVHPSNPVTDLSQAQLRGIFSGAIKDWREVGGPPGSILVLTRSVTSPTFTALDPLLRAPGTTYRADAISTPDAEAMLNAVNASARAIGMVSALHLVAHPDRARWRSRASRRRRRTSRAARMPTDVRSRWYSARTRHSSVPARRPSRISSTEKRARRSFASCSSRDPRAGAARRRHRFVVPDVVVEGTRRPSRSARSFRRRDRRRGRGDGCSS